MKTIAKLKKTKNIEVILQVKGNQRKLLKKCVDISKTAKSFSKIIQSGKKERNRIEKRTINIFHKNNHNLGNIWNDAIKTIIKVKRNIKMFNTKTKQFDQSEETAFYISTTNKLSTEEFADVIRSHWGIENSHHYVRDVSLREDFSRIRKNPENIATLRSFALNIMRANNEKNISQALYRNALNVRRVLNYYGINDEGG